MDELKLLIQVVDFIVKACKAFVQTEAGQKELQDIENAVDALDGETGSQSGSLEGALFSTLESARAAIRKGK